MSTRAFLSIESVDNGCLSHACNTPYLWGTATNLVMKSNHRFVFLSFHRLR